MQDRSLEEQAQDAHRDAHRYRTLIESSPLAAFVCRDDVLVFANAAAARLFGAPTADDLLGSTLRARVHEACQGVVSGRLLAAANGDRATLSTEAQFVALDGTLIDVELDMVPVLLDALPAVHCTARDITQRKATDAANARAAARARMTLEVSPVPMALNDDAMNITYLNPAFVQTFGYERDELATLADWWPRAYPDPVYRHWVAEAWQSRLDDAKRTGEPFVPLEVAVRCRDGSTKTVLSSAASLSGSFDGEHMVLLYDITDRKLAEETLRLARFSVDAASDAIFWISSDARFLDVNSAACHSMGYTRDELLRMHVGDVDPAYDAARWPSHFDELRLHGTLTFDSEQRAKDGRIIPVEVAANYLVRGADEINCAFVRDISARRQAEAELRLEGAALKAVANAVVIANRDGVIEWINPAFTSITGYTSEESVGRSPRELLRSGVQDEPFYRDMWSTILAGDVWRGEIVNKRKDGSRYTEEMAITPLRDPGGEISHFIAIKQDVSQRKELEAQFRQAQKMESVGLLAGGVAHDFNNMLGVILGTVELAMDQVDATLPLYEDLLEIRRAAVRSANLTRQLLAFARQQTIAPTVIDLNTTLPGMLTMLQRLIGEDIHLVWQPAVQVWPILIDPSQIDQILTNLCVNARHAIVDVGTVTIATANVTVDAAMCAVHAEATPGDYVRISVRDTGIGMNDETRAHIFEPFFSTKGVGQGTGLGLATVYGAVRQNHGFISVSSVVGQGTAFDLHFPRHRGAVEHERQSGAMPQVAGGGETILVVEDEPALLRLASKALQAHGYAVLAASGPTEALHLADAHGDEIQLLLSDIVMPEMNGRDLASALRAARPTLKSLYMSGHTADVIAIRGLLEHDVELIEKPFTPKSLLAKVRAVLDHD